MEVAAGSKTGKRTGYQYRDDGRTMARVEIIEIRDMSALFIANKLSSLLFLFYPSYSRKTPLFCPCIAYVLPPILVAVFSLRFPYLLMYNIHLQHFLS